MSYTISSSGGTGAITETITPALPVAMPNLADAPTISVTSPAGNFQAGDILLANTMPEAEYMYGCTPTAVGMILGYYDLYGYRGADFSDLIDGDVDLKSRGTDGNAYDMDAFDTVLGRAIATEDYVYRFFSRGDLDVITGNKAGSYWTTSVEEELEYSFANGGEGPEMRTDVWNCIADYLGTGQIWRGNDNLSTSISQSTLEDILNYNMNINYVINGIQRLVDWRFTSMLYGLHLYVENKGYSLDRKISGTYVVDAAGGDFTFEDYKAEIDAGRPVLISIEGHSMVGYGYNPETNEIIFDDCYNADQRMAWDGKYYYSDVYLPLQSITVIGLMADGGADIAVTPLSVDSAEIFFTANAVPFASGDYCYPGDTVGVNFTVSNLGTTASGAFEVTVYVDGKLLKSVAVLSLEGNSSEEHTDILLDSLAPGLHTVRVVADEANEIQEASGANNVLEQKLMILKDGANIVTGIKAVNAGQVSKDDYVASGWQMHVLDGGTASGTVVRGIVTDVTNGVISYLPGLVVVSQGGLIQDAEVYEYGQIQLAGTAEDLHVFENGTAVIQPGGKLTGKLTVENGGGVSMDEGTVLDFDLTRTEAGAAALVNVLSRIQGTPLYTLTVDGTEANGTYALAGGAAGFNSTITVQNTLGESIGTLTIDNPLITEDTIYTLNLGTETAAEALTLTVARNDTTAPVITLKGDTETVLRQTTLTAEVDDGSEIYFRISEFGVWKKYTGPIVASFNETYYFKATDEAGNEGTNQITFGNIDTTGILLSTLWTQKGVCPMGGNTTVCYDEYTPYDPTVTPDTHSLVGCVNTAVGQLIYYFIEKHGLDLALTLKDSDEYTSSHKADEGDPIVIEIKSDGSTPGTLSFAEINGYLSDFKLDSAEHAAALLYACGVAHKSKYAAASTGTSWKHSIFIRFGFNCVNIDGPYLGMGYYYWGYWDDDFKIHVSDAGYEVLIENLEAGRAVGAAYRGHALVIDGYDRETDTFHINFGWGYNQATRWYTRDEMFELQLNDFVYDLMVDYVETFTVTDARLYGTGTMLRAFEQASGMVGANTVVFDSSVAGKTVELENNIKVTDETTVKGFNMNVLVTSVFTDETPAYGVYSDTGGILSFHASGGSLIVSTSNEYTHAFDMSDALSGTVTADNTLIYAGRNSDGAAAVLQSLQNSRSGNTEVSEDLLDSNGWSFYGSAGNDVFTLSNSSIAVGNVTLGDGDDTLSLTGRSRLYGTIDAGDGNDSITIDSASSISGDLSGKSKLNFVLAELEDHALFTVKSSVSDLYSNATLSVDMTDAEIGTYTLVSAAPGAVGIEDMQIMVFTVTGSGGPDFTLSVNGTSTGDYADLIYENNSLKLQVKKESATVKPQTQTWEEIGDATQYIVEYSTDNFEHVIQIAVDSNALNSYQLPAGNYQVRVKTAEGDWTVIEPVDAPEVSIQPQKIKSNADGSEDLFFAAPVGAWENGYYAQHVGSINDWTGTNEIVFANGKGRIRNLFFGSADPNVLCLSDGENGDAIFVDDVYTDLPDSVAEHTARLYRIQEIRAGAGDDIIDMTSQRFEYIGDGLTIRGGEGNDTIWANKGDNVLFGDAGNDRIVGASGSDVIVGGIGDDSMHGGGGDDMFAFCGNWGADTVQQLETGSVTLWFASGAESNWNAETLTYTDGGNSVTVSGVTADRITLKFGENGPEDAAQFASLSGIGAFDAFTSRKVFEEADTGLLA